MTDPKQNSYDLVPYDSRAFNESHPDRLATTATLAGRRPPTVTRARVLELGCASGGNIIPMALSLPESHFVGIDLSLRQIEHGRQRIETLGLKNVELKHLNILDVSREFGPFDYIVAHGVFSWVSVEVQEKIFDICAQNLDPNGVAYISYNTYPGWHMRGMIRDMMLYHARQYTDPQVRVKQARNLLDFLAQSARQEGLYSSLLKSEVEEVRGCIDSYLFHEHLEDVNLPVYFHQFAERAAAKGLQYLGEVDFKGMSVDHYPPEVRSVLQILSPDTIHLQQYLDFLRNQMFRRSLLCHKGAPIDYRLRPELLASLWVAAPGRPVSQSPDITSTNPEQFTDQKGLVLTTSEPIVKAALIHLAQTWPKAIPFEELRAVARAALNPGTTPGPTVVAQDTRILGEALLACYANGATTLIELHAYDHPFVTAVSERPVASPLARLQATEDGCVTNLRHEETTLESFDRQLLPALDGSRDRAALLAVATDLAVSSEFTVREDGQPVRDPERIRQLAGTLLDKHLVQLAHNAMLVG
jgi:methyltransferase-like protein/2-polyprenyl-3-methyl-5-hydroxy-6-metoxy-1,4-benzoquinol methylase